MIDKQKLDIAIVIDLEATCWKGAPPPGQRKEIIEIGVCLVDLKVAKRLDNTKRSIIVKPENSTVSEFCTELTNITQEEVEKGISLKEACILLQNEYNSKSRTWASWGDYDEWKLQEECKEKGVEYPFSDRHINIKTRFGVDKGLSKEVELDIAMEMTCCPFEGHLHQGADDAWNAAYILVELIKKSRT